MGKKKKTEQLTRGMKWVMNKLGTIGYGYIREGLSQKLSELPFVKQLPVTEYTDEALMLGFNFLAKKMGGNKIPVVRSALKTQDSVEWSRVGETLRRQFSGTRTTSTTGAQGQLLF